MPQVSLGAVACTAGLWGQGAQGPSQKGFLLACSSGRGRGGTWEAGREKICCPEGGSGLTSQAGRRENRSCPCGVKPGSGVTGTEQSFILRWEFHEPVPRAAFVRKILHLAKQAAFLCCIVGSRGRRVLGRLCLDLSPTAAVCPLGPGLRPPAAHRCLRGSRFPRKTGGAPARLERGVPLFQARRPGPGCHGGHGSPGLCCKLCSD